MRNSDMPAMPNDLHPSDAGMLPQFSGGVNARDLARWRCGLTKREYFAGLAMQGIVASTTNEDAASEEKVAKWAVQHADALLAELEKEAQQ